MNKWNMRYLVPVSLRIFWYRQQQRNDIGILNRATQKYSTKKLVRERWTPRRHLFPESRSSSQLTSSSHSFQQPVCGTRAILPCIVLRLEVIIADINSVFFHCMFWNGFLLFVFVGIQEELPVPIQGTVEVWKDLSWKPRWEGKISRKSNYKSFFCASF